MFAGSTGLLVPSCFSEVAIAALYDLLDFLNLHLSHLPGLLSLSVRANKGMGTIPAAPTVSTANFFIVLYSR